MTWKINKLRKIVKFRAIQNVPLIRYLRSLKYDILCLQEIHADTIEIQNTLNLRFQVHSAHCGIVNLNPAIEIQSPFITEDG